MYKYIIALLRKAAKLSLPSLSDIMKNRNLYNKKKQGLSKQNYCGVP